MAWSSWVLNWGLLKFQDGYEAAGQTDMMCDMARWPLEYFLKAWRPSSQEFYVQVSYDMRHMIKFRINNTKKKVLPL